MGLLDWDRIPFTVVRYDARGHGESQSTPDLDGYSWSELARDQLALADALGIDTYVAAGASMGCGTALHAGVLGGGRVRALVLAIPPTAGRHERPRPSSGSRRPRSSRPRGSNRSIAARAELDPPDPYLGDDRRRELQAAATRAWDPGRLALVMRGATRANFPDRSDIARIDVPALILAWTGDPIHPLSTAEELHSLLPDSELHVASTAADLSSWTDLTVRFLKRALDS